MSISTYRHHNLTKHNASKKTFNVSQFYGVEYKRSQLETKDYHATDIKNIVYKDKTNQKRSGYEQVAKAPYNVNGYYDFYDESGNFHQIMHIKTSLYEVTNLEKNSNYWETKFNLISSGMADHKSMAFSSKGILYILDGTKYRYLRLNNGSLELNDVVGSDIVYIPTTSILGQNGSTIAYEDVNMLTKWRKNKLLGVSNNVQEPILLLAVIWSNSQTDEATISVFNPNGFEASIYTSHTIGGSKTLVSVVGAYKVLTPNVDGKYVYLGKTIGSTTYYSKPIEIKQENEQVEPTNYEWHIDSKIVVGSSLYTQGFFDGVELNMNGSSYKLAFVTDHETRTEDNITYYDYYFFDEEKITSTTVSGITTSTYNGSSYLADAKGRLSISDNKNVYFVAFNNDLDLEKENDVFIKIFDWDGQTLVNDYEKIDGCTFGIVYNDRLFVSGNPNYKNTDWHTQPITNYGNDEIYGDFTYFSDLDYCNYGSGSTSVVGYDIFSDGNLIVFKEPSRFEPTIYRRYKELKVATSYTGEVVENQGTELYEEGYPCFPINTMGGDGAIKNCSIANFLGNTLVLTKGGLKKLFTRQNTYNSERILVDVSSNINLAIKKEDLSNAFLFTFKDRLILQIGDITYVAYDSLKEDNEYEWYKLEGIKANIFFEIDNELYFSDIDGNICRINDGEYVFKDRDRIYTALGSTLPSGNIITINEAYKDQVSDGDKVLMLGHYSNDVIKPLNYKIGDITKGTNPNYLEYDGYTTTTDNKTKIILNSVNESFYDGLKVYLIGDNVDETYKLEVVDDTIEQEYYIKNSSNNYVDLSNSVGFNVYISTEDKNLVVDDYDSTNHTFSLVNELGDAATFYTTGTTGYSCIITHESNVEAYYITRPYDMGSIGYDKTIWQYTIANDTNLESVTDLGYLANRKQGIAAFAKGNKGLRFDEYNFGTISFLNDGLPHIYTKYRMIPSVNFIRFTFKNLFDSNMVLSQLSFVYTISGQVRGSK